MANLILPGGPRRGVVRPTGPFLMNRDSPQSSKLAGWWPMTGWSGLRGMGLQPLDMIPQGSLPRTMLPNAGLVPNFTGSVWANTGVVPYSASGTQPFTMSFNYWSLQNLGTSTFSQPWSTTETGTHTDTTRDKEFYVQPLTGHVRFFVYDGSEKFAESTMNVNDGTARLLTGTYDGTTLRLYINGIFNASVAASSSYGFSSAQFVWSLLATGSFTEVDFIGQMWDVRYSLKCLSPAEVWALRDPATCNELYWVPSTRAYGFLSSGAVVTAPEISTTYTVDVI